MNLRRSLRTSVRPAPGRSTRPLDGALPAGIPMRREVTS